MIVRTRNAGRTYSTSPGRPLPAAATPSSTVTPTTRPVSRHKYLELSALPPATNKLVFNSLPYSSPKHILFPPASALSVSYSCPIFSLRASRLPPRTTRPAIIRSPSSETAEGQPEPEPVKTSPRDLSPFPPPSLLHTTAPTATPFLSPDQFRARQIVRKEYHAPYRLDLTILVGKKKVHKSAVIRNRCRSRLREAIRVVVMRGGNSSLIVDENGDKKRQKKKEDKDGEQGVVVFDQKYEGAKKWLVSGYSYVFSIPSLEIYRHPFVDLVALVHSALLSVKIKAENAIFQAQLDQIPAPTREQEDAYNRSRDEAEAAAARPEVMGTNDHR